MPVDKERIGSFYEKYLGRQPDIPGLEHFQQYDVPIDVERAIIGSDEFRRNDRLVRFPGTPVAWKICILEEAKLIFVPIAKNAHTSILSALLKLRGIDWRAFPIHDELCARFGTDDDKVHAVLASHDTGLLLKDLSPDRIDKILRDPEYLRVTVFRDPLDRIVSACNHFFVQEAKNPLAQQHAAQVVNAFEHAPDTHTISNPCEFWLRRLIKFLALNRHIEHDPHWAPQYEYIKGLRIDHIVPIERLDILEKIVAARSGKRLHIESRNARGTRDGSRDAMNQELRDAIEEHYWIDRNLYEAARTNAGELDRQFGGGLEYTGRQPAQVTPR